MPDTPNTNPASTYCDDVLNTVAAAEEAGERIRYLTRAGVPGTPAERLQALLELWDLLDMDPTDADHIQTRAARLQSRRVAGKDLRWPAAELFARIDREIIAAVAAGGQDPSDPVVDVSAFKDVVVYTLTNAQGYRQRLPAVLYADLPQGHPLRKFLAAEDCYSLRPTQRGAATLVVLLGPRWEQTTDGSKKAAGWCRVSQAVRLTKFWKAEQDKDAAKKAEDEVARREWREKEYAERPDIKAQRLEAEIAAMRAEIDRLKAGAAAGQGAPA